MSNANNPSEQQLSIEVETNITRKPWQKPLIEDADAAGVTNGAGTSGVEGSPFLKSGS
jgi:hypothetical protein